MLRHRRRMRTPLIVWPRRSTVSSSNSRSTNTVSSFMTMAGRSAFASWRRIRSGCRRLSSRMPMSIRKAWAPSGSALRNIGTIRRHIQKCSMPSCRSQPPNSVTPSVPRIPNVIIRTPGLTSTPTCRNRANARSRPVCCTTTGRMSHPIRRGKRGCASTGRRLWWSGEVMIPRSLRPGERRSSAMSRMPKFTCSMPAILPWTRRTTRSRSLVLTFLAKHSV